MALGSPAGESSGQPAATASNWVLIRRMLALGWKYRLGCLHVLAQQIGLVLLSLSGLGLVGLGIDFLGHSVSRDGGAPHWPFGLSPPADWSPLTTTFAIGVAIVLAALVQNFLRYRAAVTAAGLTQKIVVELRSGVYDKLQRLSFRFYDSNQSGSIINRVTGDVQAVRAFIDGVLIQVVVVLVSLSVYLVYMLHVHVGLTLACLATPPLLWITTVRFARRLRPAYRRDRELSDKMVLVLAENFQGAQVVRGFAREPEEIGKYRAANRHILESKYGIFWQLSLFQPFIGGLTQLNLLVLLVYGGRLCMQGELSLGEGLFVFANLLQQFATQIGQIANIGNSIQTSLIGAQRVFEVLDAPIEIANVDEPQRVERPRGHLKFEKVSFAHRPGQDVLSGIDLEIKPGECLALVGETGAGKTTLLNLVARFYDPTEGRVLLDGIDLREIEVADLRRNIGLVFQENFLFSNTVAANIAFGRPESERGPIKEAARQAAAAEFVEDLPQRYDALVGEHGANLSGGQRQRLAIARALLLDPAILMLDDATTAIDPETEHEILDALAEAAEGRTTLMVGNRLSALRRADRIIVLDQGRIVQIGTHDELAEEPGRYREMVLLQTTHGRQPPEESAAPRRREVA